MPRCVLALVAFAALAGFGLAGYDDKAKCANSCDCHCSGSMNSPPIIGAASKLGQVCLVTSSKATFAKRTREVWVKHAACLGPASGICFVTTRTYARPLDELTGAYYLFSANFLSSRILESWGRQGLLQVVQSV